MNENRIDLNGTSADNNGTGQDPVGTVLASLGTMCRQLAALGQLEPIQANIRHGKYVLSFSVQVAGEAGTVAAMPHQPETSPVGKKLTGIHLRILAAAPYENEQHVTARKLINSTDYTVGAHSREAITVLCRQGVLCRDGFQLLYRPGPRPAAMASAPGASGKDPAPQPHSPRRDPEPSSPADMEADALQALTEVPAGTALSLEDLARRAGYEPDEAFRNAVTNLGRKGEIERVPQGFRLAAGRGAPP